MIAAPPEIALALEKIYLEFFNEVKLFFWTLINHRTTRSSSDHAPVFWTRCYQFVNNWDFPSSYSFYSRFVGISILSKIFEIFLSEGTSVVLEDICAVSVMCNHELKSESFGNWSGDLEENGNIRGWILVLGVPMIIIFVKYLK